MLFSGGSTGQKGKILSNYVSMFFLIQGTPPKESKKERKPDKDEKYEAMLSIFVQFISYAQIQEAVFLHWINSVIDDSLQDLK